MASANLFYSNEVLEMQSDMQGAGLDMRTIDEIAAMPCHDRKTGETFIEFIEELSLSSIQGEREIGRKYRSKWRDQ